MSVDQQQPQVRPADTKPFVVRPGRDYLRWGCWQQRFIATFGLTPNYAWPGHRTEIEIAGIERIPKDQSVIFVMNHTDFYNYWPFQWKLWRGYYPRLSVTWVKPQHFSPKLLG